MNQKFTETSPKPTDGPFLKLSKQKGARSNRRLSLVTISGILVLFIVGTTLVGCSRGTPITVINQSGVALEDLVLSGSGFSKDVGLVPPGEQVRIVVRPRGESGLRIQFNARGKAVSFGPDGYFEGGGGYVVTVTVSPSLTVSVKSELAY
jgi:hypothetical protein